MILLTGVATVAVRPGSLMGKFEILRFSIYYLTTEHYTQQELDLAFGAVLTLLTLTPVLISLPLVLPPGLAKVEVLMRGRHRSPRPGYGAR